MMKATQPKNWWMGLLLWCAMTAAAALLTALIPTGSDEPEAQGHEVARKRLTAQGAGKFPIGRLLALPTETDRLDLLGEWLDSAQGADFRRLFFAMEQVEGTAIWKIAPGAILDRWIREDPDDAWEFYLSEPRLRGDLVNQWLDSGDAADLWEKIEATEGTIEHALLQEEFLEQWENVRPGDAELLESITGLGELDLLPFRVADLVRRGDSTALVELGEEWGASVESEWIYRDLKLTKSAAEMLSFSEEFPEFHRRRLQSLIIEDWPADADPQPAIEVLSGLDDSYLMTQATLGLIASNNDSEKMTDLVRRLAAGEGGLSRYWVIRSLEELANHHPVSARQLLPEIDPLMGGMMIEHMATQWPEEDMAGALQFTSTLRQGHQQDAFLADLLIYNRDDETLREWAQGQSQERRRLLGIEESEGED